MAQPPLRVTIRPELAKDIEGMSEAEIDAMIAELISERIMEMQVKRGGFRRLERRWGVPSGLKNNLGDCAKMLTVLPHLRMRTHAQHAILPPPEERRAA